MTVRACNGARITLDEGTLDTFRSGGILNGAWTFTVTFKRSGSTTDGTQYLFSGNNSGSVRFGISYTTGNVIQVEVAGTVRTFGAGFTISNDVWYTLTVRKPGGTSTPVAQLATHSASLGTTYTAWTNGTGTFDDSTDLLDELQIANRPNDFPLNGKIAGLSWFSSDVGATVGRKFGTGLQNWRNASPVAMWTLQQSVTSTPVDDIQGSADETALTGTTVDTTDDPPNFALALGTAAPVLLDYAESAYASGSPRVTDDLDWAGNGDRVVCLCATEDNGVLQGVPTATGLTLAAMSGTPTNTASSCKAYAWSAQASADGNSTLSSTQSGNSGSAGLSAWAYQDSSALGTPVVLVNTALVVSVTVEANSSVVMVLADWNAAVASAPVLTPAGGVLRENTNVSGAATFLVAEWNAQAAGTRNYGVSSGWSGTGTVSKIAVEAKGTASGGTDLPYDGEGETPLVQDAPARATLDEAFGADGTTPRLQDTPARAGFDIPYGADQLGARALTAAPASAGTGVGGLADQAGARAGVQPARAALAVATASDARGGAPVPSTARSAVSVAISTDSVGARPALGLAVSQLNESGAEDLLYTSDTVAARALTAQARSALDEMFRAIPHPSHLADASARSEAGIAYGADYRVPLTLRNAAARVLADQSALGRMSVPLLGRGLAVATLGTGQPLPVDVFANMGPLTVSGNFAPLSVKAKFGGSSVAGWVP